MPDYQYVKPVNGQVTTPFGGAQAYSPGMSLDIGSVNRGVDLAVPAGTPVLSPVGGTVTKVYHSRLDDRRGQRDARENGGWGGQIIIQGEDGFVHYLDHLQFNSIGVQDGAYVEKGQPVARVGVTGNSTGPHLDWEKRNAKGQHVDPLAATFVGAGPQPALPAGQGKVGTAAPLTQGTRPMATTPNSAQITTLSRQRDEAKAQVTTYQSAVQYASENLARMRGATQDANGDYVLPTEEGGTPQIVGDADVYAGAVKDLEGRLAYAQARLKDAQNTVQKAEQDLASVQDDAAKQLQGKPGDTIVKGEGGRFYRVERDDSGRETLVPISVPGAENDPDNFKVVGDAIIDIRSGQAIYTAPDRGQTALRGAETGLTEARTATENALREPTVREALAKAGLTEAQITTENALRDPTVRQRLAAAGLDEAKIKELEALLPGMVEQQGAQTTLYKAQGANVQAEADMARLRFQLLQRANEDITAALQMPEGPERTAAIMAAMEKYAALTDVPAAMRNMTDQAQLRLQRANALAEQTGYQYDPLTLDPVLGPDGTPVPTAGEAERGYRRELDYTTRLAEHERDVMAGRTQQQQAATTALESAGRYGLASPVWLGNIMQSQAPVSGLPSIAQRMGINQNDPIYQGALAAMQASGAIDANGMPKMPAPPQRPQAPSTVPPQAPGGTFAGQRSTTPAQARRITTEREDREDGSRREVRTTETPPPPAQPALAPEQPVPQEAAAPAGPAQRRPVPGMEAEDLGNGLARTHYDDGSYEDWEIGGGGSVGAGAAGGGYGMRGGGYGTPGWNAGGGMGGAVGATTPAPRPQMPVSPIATMVTPPGLPRGGNVRPASIGGPTGVTPGTPLSDGVFQPVTPLQGLMHAVGVYRPDRPAAGGGAYGQGGAGDVGSVGGVSGVANPLYQGATREARRRVRRLAGLPEEPPRLTSGSVGFGAATMPTMNVTPPTPPSPTGTGTATGQAGASSMGMDTRTGHEGGRYSPAFGGQTVAPSTPATIGAGTAGITYGYGVPGFGQSEIRIRPEYMGALQDPNLAPGYIPGSGTYNQFRLDQPGLFGGVGPNNTLSNLRYGLGGTGDPTTGREVQTPEEWVNGPSLFQNNNPANWGQTNDTRGLDYIATLFLRPDTPSGINTAAWSAPQQFWDGLYQQIQAGRVTPTERGWQLLQQRGYPRLQGAAGQGAQTGQTAAQRGPMGTGIRGGGGGGGGPVNALVATAYRR